MALLLLVVLEFKLNTSWYDNFCDIISSYSLEKIQCQIDPHNNNFCWPVS